MKKLFFISVLLITTYTNAQNWQLNFDKSKDLASQKEQKIILVFEGSDWCATCKKLEKNIFTTSEFIEFSNKNVVLLKADFPKRKKNRLAPTQQKHNEALAEKYNPRGVFPLVLVLDKKGNVLGTTGYKKTTPQKYIEELKTFIN